MKNRFGNFCIYFYFLATFSLKLIQLVLSAMYPYLQVFLLVQVFANSTFQQNYKILAILRTLQLCTCSDLYQPLFNVFLFLLFSPNYVDIAQFQCWLCNVGESRRHRLYITLVTSDYVENCSFRRTIISVLATSVGQGRVKKDSQKVRFQWCR